MIIRFLFTLAAGCLITWMIQTNGLTKTLWKRHELLKELRQCDLCLGFWVFLAFGLTMKDDNQLGIAGRRTDPIIFAFVGSFLSHVFKAGLVSKFGYVTV